ncbi:MAG: hypothetical protein I4E98_04195 [Planktothrix agardhii KL2]|uniref:hypothetical protein n=1 Tax=Planktothrix agardhii TaxID=1160 RepID=UPI001A356075|nr:hypothetical protein [Planktothrix agardhii]MBG0745789.1 hypothetical protein [Planktothrix agardhii KL2]MCF3572192.1 hypothetical protein [Planktothrix agardhii 1805]MCF3621980.1 hypothetical protein [Planktothrix agardhii 1030]MEA5559845.1 hypothetical protein [Planktothrix agardhii UHCC 0887]
MLIYPITITSIIIRIVITNILICFLYPSSFLIAGCNAASAIARINSRYFLSRLG